MKLRHVLLLAPVVLYAQDPIPQLAVSYFNALSCPTGWAPYTPAQGRTIVGVGPADGVRTSVETPLANGEVRTHYHQFTNSINLGNTGYFADFIPCCNSSLAANGTAQLTNIPSTSDDPNLPYVQFLACQKMDPPQPGPIPRGTTVFYEGFQCPTGWSDVEDAHGRFPVGGESTGGAFGGPPLAPGENRTHTHSYSGSIVLPAQTIVDLGGSNEGFAHSGTYKVSGTTTPSYTHFPYLQLLQCSKDAPGPPMISGVLNAAGFSSGAIAPGQIISIFGENLGPDPGVGAQLVNGKLPTTLGGVEVDFPSGPAPLFYASNSQINVQVPYETVTSPDISIVYQEQRSDALTLPFATSAPGLFTNNPPNSDLAIAVLGNQLVSQQLPVPQGQAFVLYATGGGLTNPSSKDGTPRNPPLSMPILPVKVTIGGVDATLDYAGAAPGFVGLMQINARLGAGTPSGKQPITLKIGQVESSSGVYLYVK